MDTAVDGADRVFVALMLPRHDFSRKPPTSPKYPLQVAASSKTTSTHGLSGVLSTFSKTKNSENDVNRESKAFQPVR